MLLVVLFTVFSQVLATIKIDSLPISANFKPSEGSTLLDRDRARIQGLFARHEKRAKTKGVALQNMVAQYTVSVGFGSPPTYYKLQIDPGSAHTWIGADQKYVSTQTSIKQSYPLNVRYTKGAVAGMFYTDLATFSPSLSVADFPFGVATEVNLVGLSCDGILGLAPPTLDRSTSILNHLYTQKKIKRNMFGLSFTPFTSQGILNGRLTLGGTDPHRYTGKLNWVKIIETGHLNWYWSFEQTIKHGKRVIQPPSAGVIDAGTTMIYITPQAFKAYAASIPGSKLHEGYPLIEIPKESVAEMKSLFFVIGGVSYELTPNAQLWPRKLNGWLGGRTDVYYSVICSLSDEQVSYGVNFINGYVFSQRFYTAYDASSSKIRVGFAITPSTYANVN